MANIAYVNGQYIPQAEAVVHIEDRGYQFSDGIYEYIAFYNRRMLDGVPHLARMQRSLKELGIPEPMSGAAMQIVIEELIARNAREHGGLYIQVSRGVARRDHAFPKGIRPSLVITLCAPKFPKQVEIEEGVRVITQPDLRWVRRDIKSVSLLANVLAKQEASAAKAREAWLLEGDRVTEGAVSNSYIVTKKNVLVTHPADTHILGGITREKLLELARKDGIAVEERPFSLYEALDAGEAFLTSTSVNVLPVVKIDDKSVGGGKPGEITRLLQFLYAGHVFRETGFAYPLPVQYGNAHAA